MKPLPYPPLFQELLMKFDKETDSLPAIKISQSIILWKDLMEQCHAQIAPALHVDSICTFLESTGITWLTVIDCSKTEHSELLKFTYAYDVEIDGFVK